MPLRYRSSIRSRCPVSRRYLEDTTSPMCANGNRPRLEARMKAIELPEECPPNLIGSCGSSTSTSDCPGFRLHIVRGRSSTRGIEGRQVTQFVPVFYSSASYANSEKCQMKGTTMQSTGPPAPFH